MDQIVLVKADAYITNRMFSGQNNCGMGEAFMGETITKDCTIAAQHPCTRGHFPGQPIVPGAFLLARVEQLILEDHPGFRMASLRRIKFQKPLTPGTPAQLTYVARDNGNGMDLRFSMRDSVDYILEGRGLLVPL